MMRKDETPLLADPESPSYGAASAGPNALDRTWSSFQEGRRLSAVTSKNASFDKKHPIRVKEKKTRKGFDHYVYCVIYAIVNVIISAPGLYGYTAVIFNNPVFDNHMNALSKLVIFSSLIHQLGFFLFSTLDFAIGTVQDAGLIFLSAMANKIANRMLEDGHGEDEVLSTTIVLLCLGTACLGLVLILMGRFRLADAVAYLPMPVVGGYLAFIGYFCCQAGVALCISKPMMTLGDWKYMFESEKLILAVTGLTAGLVLTLTSRLATNSGALPLVMVGIPALFYSIMYLSGSSLEDVRESGWVGAEAPSVPVKDLFTLVDFRQVRWDLIAEILPTWVGMIFVVSFASCLDVAAISIDMGEALDTNKELTTVGICNLMSGLTFGFTGSYIFSQTIFTYRTGVHDRIIGVMIMAVFLYIVVSPVNVLEISPLFFLGSTLIFIGYDLMFEWLWEVRHQVFLSEYFVVWLTFCAIHAVGIDFGIIIGVLIAIVEQVVTTAQTTVVNRVQKRSRAVWAPADSKVLNDHAYNSYSPKVVILEVVGTVFFGSALHLLNLITDEIGLVENSSDFASPMSPRTPHTSSSILTKSPSLHTKSHRKLQMLPKYLVLDLRGMSNLDASATRGCFLQLVKMCTKRGIIVSASGASQRIEWMFRSHDVSMSDLDEEQSLKGKLLSPEDRKDAKQSLEKILLFVTVQEALEFCETSVIQFSNNPRRSLSLSQIAGLEVQSISNVLAYILGSSEEEIKILSRLEDKRYHDEVEVKSNAQVFYKNAYADAFYIVLNGCVALQMSTLPASRKAVVSGAGFVRQKRVGSSSDLFDKNFLEEQKKSPDSTVSTWRAGGVFGYLDYLMDRRRAQQALSTQDGTKLAKFSHSHMNLLQEEDPTLYALVQKVLLHASTLDLANCTCRDV